MNHLYHIVYLSATILLSKTVLADEIKVISFGDKDFTSDEFVKSITGTEGNDEASDLPPGLMPSNSGTGVKYRGIVLKRNSNDLADTSNPPSVSCPAQKTAIALSIQFNVNSADISTEAKKSLDKISSAMNQKKIIGCNFTIEGHTDSSGSTAYNQLLSEKRAIKVREYLVSRNVSSLRLSAVGKGELEPLDSKDSSINRRVQFSVY